MLLYIAQSGDLDRCYRCLTHKQTTEYSATQLVKSIMFKVTQHTGLPTKTKPLNPKKYNSDMWKREGSAFLVWVTIFSLLLKGSER